MLSIQAKVGKKTRIAIAFFSALSIPPSIAIFLKNLKNNRAKKRFEEIITNNSTYERQAIDINHNLIHRTNCTDDELLNKIINYLSNPKNTIPSYLNILKIVDIPSINEKSILTIQIPKDILALGIDEIDKIDQITPYIMEFQERKRVDQISEFIRLVDTLDLKKKPPNNRYIQCLSLDFNGNRFEIHSSPNNTLHLEYKSMNVAVITENKITIDNPILKEKFEIDDTNIYKIIKNMNNVLSYIVKDRGTNNYSINPVDLFFEIFNDLEDVDFLGNFIKLFLNFEANNLNTIIQGLYNLITSLFTDININILKSQTLKNTMLPSSILGRNGSIDIKYSNAQNSIEHAFDKNTRTNFTITEYINKIKMAENIITSASNQIDKNKTFLSDNISLIDFFLDREFIIQYLKQMDPQKQRSIEEVFNNVINKLGNIKSIEESMLSIFFSILDFSCKSQIHHIFKQDDRINSIQNSIIREFNLNNTHVQGIFNSNDTNEKKWNDLIERVAETSKDQNKTISKMDIEDRIFKLNSNIKQTYSSNDEILLQPIQKICSSINNFLKLIKGNKDTIRNILKYCFTNKNIPVTIVNNEIIINGIAYFKLN